MKLIGLSFIYNIWNKLEDLFRVQLILLQTSQMLFQVDCNRVPSSKRFSINYYHEIMSDRTSEKASALRAGLGEANKKYPFLP